MDMDERRAKGMLWADTEEYFARQGIAKGKCYDFNHLRPEDREARIAMLPEIFGAVGENVWVEPPLMVALGKTVTLGEGTYVNSGLTLVDDYTITIGKRVLLGPNVTISTTGHPVHHKLRGSGEMYSFAVTIGDDAWLGGHVIVCPGVTIGERAVVGAGSVVLKDVPPGVIAAGNPCRVIREITDRDLEYYYRDFKVE